VFQLGEQVASSQSGQRSSIPASSS
jgi:hypothetical protein